LLAYTRGGLWRIQPDGVWSVMLDGVPPGNAASAVLADEGGITLFDGAQLLRYDRNGRMVWQIPLAAVKGQVSLAHDGPFILLTSSDGTILAVRSADGAVCNTTRIYGDLRSRLWSSLDTDGMLRVYVADQILGLDWRDFLLACA
jgi:outer membrane protein assembly factor BamB